MKEFTPKHFDDVTLAILIKLCTDGVEDKQLLKVLFIFNKLLFRQDYKQDEANYDFRLFLLGFHSACVDIYSEVEKNKKKELSRVDTVDNMH